MFAHICTDNKEFSADYIQTLVGQLPAAPTIYMKYFDRAILRVI